MHVYTFGVKNTLNPMNMKKLSQKLRGKHPLYGDTACDPPRNAARYPPSRSTWPGWMEPISARQAGT